MSINFIKVGVIGHPINHSKSPLIHNHWIKKYGLRGEYKAIDILPENLNYDVRSLIDQGYAGFNVTIPYKQNIISLCDEIDDAASIIGAVNTIAVKDNKIYGANTDSFGFIQNLKTNNHLFQKDRSILVLGAGGAARGVAYGLLQDGFDKIIVTNRTLDKAQELLKMHPSHITVCPWDKRETSLKDISLLVNTTSLGMMGKQTLDLDLSKLSNDTIVCDIVYNPLMTPLLLAAQNKGCPIVTGIGMLLQQARPAFQEWFGVLPELDDDLIQKVLS